MSFFPYLVCALLGVDSLQGGLAKGNRILVLLWSLLSGGGPLQSSGDGHSNTSLPETMSAAFAGRY